MDRRTFKARGIRLHRVDVRHVSSYEAAFKVESRRLLTSREIVYRFTVVGEYGVLILAERDWIRIDAVVPAEFRVVLPDIDGRELAFITPPWAMFAVRETRNTPEALQWCQATADGAVEHVKRWGPIPHLGEEN